MKLYTINSIDGLDEFIDYFGAYASSSASSGSSASSSSSSSSSSSASAASYGAPAPIILINIDYSNGNADDLTSLLQNVTSNVQPKYSYLPPSKPLYHDSGHGGYSGGYSPGWLPLS